MKHIYSTDNGGNNNYDQVYIIDDTETINRRRYSH